MNYVIDQDLMRVLVPINADNNTIKEANTVAENLGYEVVFIGGNVV